MWPSKAETKPPTAFTLIGYLGQGGQARVYKVRRENDGKVLALKRIDVSKLCQAGKQKVIEQVELHLSLKHPSIVRVDSFEMDQDGDHLLVFMEICGGGDLDKYIHARRSTRDYIPEADIWKVASQISDAILYCHNRASGGHHMDILHRDLKPANIFLADGNLHVQVGDFDLAIEVADDEEATQFAGTPRYMAPEALDGRLCGKPADCYAIGAIMLEMATLSRPAEGLNDRHSIREKVLAGLDMKIPSHYSKQLQQLIMSLLSVEPSNRPNIAQLSANPGVRWGSNQSALESLQRKHESLQKGFDQSRQQAQVKQAELTQQVKSLEAQLAQAGSANAARVVDLDLREKALTDREAELAHRADHLASKEDCLLKQVADLQHERMVFEVEKHRYQTKYDQDGNASERTRQYRRPITSTIPTLDGPSIGQSNAPYHIVPVASSSSVDSLSPFEACQTDRQKSVQEVRRKRFATSFASLPSISTIDSLSPFDARLIPDPQVYLAKASTTSVKQPGRSLIPRIAQHATKGVLQRKARDIDLRGKADAQKRYPPSGLPISRRMAAKINRSDGDLDLKSPHVAGSSNDPAPKTKSQVASAAATPCHQARRLRPSAFKSCKTLDQHHGENNAPVSVQNTKTTIVQRRYDLRSRALKTNAALGLRQI